MNKLIQELQRRNVFRVAGLYVGVAWVTIEGADVLLGIFDAPDWVARTIATVAILGFPIAAVLAWIYEFTDRGIQLDEVARDEAAVPIIKGRQLDFIIIGALTVGLSLSLMQNVKLSRDQVVENRPPVSVLISNFRNTTGESVFDGSLEQAMRIAIEGASFVSAFARDRALEVADEIEEGSSLDHETAQLVAVREGIGVVLNGTIEKDGAKGYQLTIRAIDPNVEEPLTERSLSAREKSDVLTVVGELAEAVRRTLGDASPDAGLETFTSSSLDAVREYFLAQQMALEGKDEEAVAHYEKAITFDAEFGRAYSGWANSLYKIGRRNEADEKWKEALARLDRMTEREKYRTLGVYYSLVTRNYDKAIENYQTLVELYPADGAGHNNLAVARFFSLDFEGAMESGSKVLEIYPKFALYQANYALYAMYAGENTIARETANKLIKQKPNYHKAYLPVAVAAVFDGMPDEAHAAYKAMSLAGAAGASLAAVGQADLAMAGGRPGDAEPILLAGLASDGENENTRGQAVKLAMLAELQLASGRSGEAVDSVSRLLELQKSDSAVVSAARVLLGIDKTGVPALADGLGQKLQPQSRAYAGLLDGLLARQGGNAIDAVDKLKAAIGLADLWLIRFELGRTYLEAGFAAEALAEFEACMARRGEATALFLDDVPTLRHAVPLAYWLGRAQEELGMGDAAVENYRRYLAVRSEADTDPITVDARNRVAAL